MRADCASTVTGPSFVLSCRGYRQQSQNGAPVRAGNLSFMIGNAVVAEINHADLMESWRAAECLSASEALRMTEVAGERLAEVIEGGIEAADLTDAVTDAAVVFLLAMKRFGVSDPKRIPACTVMWNGQEHREHVLLGA